MGVRVLVELPGAKRLLTAALTLSSEMPGASCDGEEGSSNTRGFFDFGGWTSCVDADWDAGGLSVSSTGSEQKAGRYNYLCRKGIINWFGATISQKHHSTNLTAQPMTQTSYII